MVRLCSLTPAAATDLVVLSSAGADAHPVTPHAGSSTVFGSMVERTVAKLRGMRLRRSRSAGRCSKGRFTGRGGTRNAPSLWSAIGVIFAPGFAAGTNRPLVIMMLGCPAMSIEPCGDRAHRSCWRSRRGPPLAMKSANTTLHDGKQSCQIRSRLIFAMASRASPWTMAKPMRCRWR